ncbi:hypothetical protein PI125_g18931 [Phytophthora idaei]|nr:hypothetical protein PI125_g18931 [Phytophthora idaei]
MPLHNIHADEELFRTTGHYRFFKCPWLRILFNELLRCLIEAPIELSKKNSLTNLVAANHAPKSNCEISM